MKFGLALILLATMAEGAFAKNYIIKHAVKAVRPIAFQGPIFVPEPAYWEKNLSCKSDGYNLIATYNMEYKPLRCKITKECVVQQYLPFKFVNKSFRINISGVCDGETPDVVYIDGSLVYN